MVELFHVKLSGRRLPRAVPNRWLLAETLDGRRNGHLSVDTRACVTSGR
jgi:hypothetical protein